MHLSARRQVLPTSLPVGGWPARGRTRHGRHTVRRLSVPIVWVTQDRYHVRKGDMHQRWRPLLVHIGAAEARRIRTGVVRKDHVPLVIA